MRDKTAKKKKKQINGVSISHETILLARTGRVVTCFILNVQMTCKTFVASLYRNKSFPLTRMSATWDQPIQISFGVASLANEEINFQKFPFVINPLSSLFRYWEIVCSFCIFLTCLIVPYQASFDSQLLTFWTLAYIFDALYLVDVSLRFFVGYFSKGTLITDRSLIRRRYLRGMFIPDLLLPLYRWICWLLELAQISDGIRH